MGKRIIPQRRGRGNKRYQAPSHNYKGFAKHKSPKGGQFSGEIVDIIHCAGHSAPLAQIQYEDGELCLMIMPEGLRVGDSVVVGGDVEQIHGNTTALGKLPEGSGVFNIEGVPGDGGKFCRASGTFAKVVNHNNGKTTIQLPSKKQKTFNSSCRATVGVVAGGGRTEKPIMKAGNMHYKMKAKNKLYPIVSGGAMNAVDHPFGNGRSSRKSKAKPVSRHAPPGRKVGMIAAKHTGRNK